MATCKTPEKNKNKAWAQYVRDRRKASGKSRRQLAADAQIDPSYWTLIERDGNIPTRAIVIRIGMLFGDAINACLLAGYTHPEISPFLIHHFRGRAPLPKTMPEDVKEMVFTLCEAEEFVRNQVVAVTRPLLAPEKKTRKTRNRGGAL